MRTDLAARSIIDLVVQCVDPDAIYMFGSAAHGRARPDSDIDLLVVADFQEPRRRRGMELRGLLADSVVPVDLHMKTPDEFDLESRDRYSLADTVRRFGILVYERAPLGS